MKTPGWLVAAILCTLVPFYGISQCGTIRTITYDTTITGGGNNDDPYEFTFPQFNSTLGTLTNVNISSVVSLQYDYDVENATNFSNLYRQRVARYDNIYSSAISPADEASLSYVRNFPSNGPPVTYYNNNLTPNDFATGSGTDYAQNSLQLLNSFTAFSHNVGTANFLGVGSVLLEYYTTTDLTINSQGPVISHNDITDQITVTLTYTYCDNILLNPGDNPRITRQPQIGESKNKLFPNPSTNGNFSLRLHDSKRSDWQIDVFNSTGQLINRRRFNNTLRADMNNNQLPKGIYIVKATNLKSQDTFSDRLLVK